MKLVFQLGEITTIKKIKWNRKIQGNVFGEEVVKSIIRTLLLFAQDFENFKKIGEGERFKIQIWPKKFANGYLTS